MLPDLKRPDIKNPEAIRAVFATSGQTIALILLPTHTLPEALHFPFYCLTLTIVRRGRTPITPQTDFTVKDVVRVTLWEKMEAIFSKQDFGFFDFFKGNL